MKNPEKLLDLLAQDARLTPAQLAAMLGETEEILATLKQFQEAPPAPKKDKAGPSHEER